MGVYISVAGKDKRTGTAILLADAVSPFRGLTLKEVFPLFSPLTLSVSQRTWMPCVHP